MSPDRGGDNFAAYCAVCHDTEGKGRSLLPLDVRFVTNHRLAATGMAPFHAAGTVEL
jgi:hypothetical protein